MGDIEYGGDVEYNRQRWQKAMLYSFAFGKPLSSLTHVSHTNVSQKDSRTLCSVFRLLALSTRLVGGSGCL